MCDVIYAAANDYSKLMPLKRRELAVEFRMIFTYISALLAPDSHHNQTAPGTNEHF
jgi:hypothetical protein